MRVTSRRRRRASVPRAERSAAALARTSYADWVVLVIDVPVGSIRPFGAEAASARPKEPASVMAEGALVMSGSPPLADKTVCVTFDGGRLTSDAGVLLLAEIERRLGIAERLARCLEDPRSRDRVHHTGR
jgi:Transposase DDE domain group 1